jgi:hypothetical protein
VDERQRLPRLGQGVGDEPEQSRGHHVAASSDESRRLSCLVLGAIDD